MFPFASLMFSSRKLCWGLTRLLIVCLCLTLRFMPNSNRETASWAHEIVLIRPVSSLCQWLGAPSCQRGSYAFYKSVSSRAQPGGPVQVWKLGEFYFIRCGPRDPVCIAEVRSPARVFDFKAAIICFLIMAAHTPLMFNEVALGNEAAENCELTPQFHSRSLGSHYLLGSERAGTRGSCCQLKRRMVPSGAGGEQNQS